MGKEGTTTGIWIPEGSNLLERYDEYFEDASRSKKIVDGMEMQLTVEQALDRADYGFPNERAKRHFVRQAILDRIRREREE